jgi:hypothetical protein
MDGWKPASTVKGLEVVPVAVESVGSLQKAKTLSTPAMVGIAAGALLLVLCMFILPLTLFLVRGGVGGDNGVSVIVGGDKLTKSNYDRIQDGMSVSKVESILGKGTEQASANVPGVSAGGYSAPGASSKILTWHSGLKTVTVTFLNDEVVSKAQSGL